MAIRNIVNIDEEKCNGCGLCISSCKEGAIAIIDGKAKLVSDIYCDGLGACLGECPQDAITVEKREAVEFDEEAAMKHVEKTKTKEQQAKTTACGCPGTMSRKIEHQIQEESCGCTDETPAKSQLGNWPVQLKLVPTNAPYFEGADLLLVADCVPFAYADFHKTLKGKPVVIGCPKLDDSGYYVDKMADIINDSQIKSLTVVNMEVPCCKGITKIAEAAIAKSGGNIPMEEITISIDGRVLSTTKY
jgi:ferredoxin